MPPILSIVCAPFIKAYAYLGWTGLLAIPLWVAAFAILLKFRRDPRRNVRYFRALVFALVAMILADFAATSASKIVIDRTEEIEAARAQQRHSRINEFGEADMASQMHFVEDSPAESSGASSMSGDSSTSLESLGAGLDDMSPEHRFGEKKQRASGRKEKVGNAAEFYEQKAKEEKPPRMMKEADVVLAGRVNWVNLRLARLALLAALLLLVWDYLVRFNRWMPGYIPLPISSPWIDSMSRKDFECTHRDDRKDSFLRDLVRRGESFIVATNGATVLDGVSSIARLDIPLGRKETARRIRLCGFPVLTVSENDPRGWEFIFDAVWFNRYAVIYDGKIESLLDALKVYLADRYETRAAARRTVNLVTTEGQLGEKTARRFFLRLLKHANWRLCEFVPAPAPESRRTGPAPQDSAAAAKPAPAPEGGRDGAPSPSATPSDAAKAAKLAKLQAKFGGKGGASAPAPESRRMEPAPQDTAAAAKPAHAPEVSDAAKAAKLAKLQAKFGGKAAPAPAPAPAPESRRAEPAPQDSAAAAKPASAPEVSDAAKAAKLAKLQAKFGGKAAPAPAPAPAPENRRMEPAPQDSAAATKPAPAPESRRTEPAPQDSAAATKPAPAPGGGRDGAPSPSAAPSDAARAAKLAKLQAKFGGKAAPAATPAPQSAAPAASAASTADSEKAARLARLQAKFGGKGVVATATAATVGVAASASRRTKSAPQSSAAAAKPAPAPEGGRDGAPSPSATASDAAKAEAPAAKPAPVPESPREQEVASPAPVAEPIAPVVEASLDPEPVVASAPEPVPEPVVEVATPVVEVAVPVAEPESVSEPIPESVPVVPVAEVPAISDAPATPVAEVPPSPVAEQPAPTPSAPGKMSFGRISISLDDLDLPPEAPPAAESSDDDDEVVVAYSRELQGTSYADVSAGVVPPSAAQVSSKKTIHTAHSQSAPSAGGKHGIKIIRKKK